MNQIPNIEEIKKILPCIDPQCDNQGTTITVNSDGEPEQMQCEYCYRERFPILNYFHQQLQKARHDWLREEIVRLEGMKEEHHYDWCKQTAPLNLASCGCWKDWNHTLQSIIDCYQAELDQDKK